MLSLVSFETWRRVALGAGAGAVFGVVLTAFLMLTGALQLSPGALPASRVVADAVGNACAALVPWLLLWLIVLPALLRVPVGQPWLALAVYVALAVALVPLTLSAGDLSTSQLVGLGIFACVTALPVVRAADVWLTASFVAAIHIVTASGVGLFFGGAGGYGFFEARLNGDVLLTGGAMGPVFGLFGMLGMLWVAGSMLQHQAMLFSAAATRVRSRRGALSSLGLGVLTAAAAVSLMFVAMLVTQQSRVIAVSPSLATVSASLTDLLPRAIADELLYRWALISLIVLVVRRGWIAVVIATAAIVAWHVASPGSNAFTAASLAASSLAGGFAFVATGRLWMPIALSYGWMLFEGPIFGFSSGGMPVRHPWLQQEILQYTEWSGGVHGPDASLFGILAKLLVVGAVLWLTSRRNLR